MNFIVDNSINAGNLIFASGGNNSIIFGLSPNDLPNLLGWYSSDYGVYSASGVLALQGQTVRIWQNKINNGINLEQPGAIQPLYLDGAIKFEQNSMSGINPVALTPSLTYYVATQTALSGGLTNTPSSIIKHDASSTVIRYRFGVNTGSFLAARASNTDYTSSLKTNNGKNIIYISFSGTPLSQGDVILGKNNSFEKISQTFGTNDSRVFVIGSNSASSAVLPLKGSIYEILIYTGLHTETEKNKIITYLSNKWGVNF